MQLPNRCGKRIPPKSLNLLRERVYLCATRVPYSSLAFDHSCLLENIRRSGIDRFSDVYGLNSDQDTLTNRLLIHIASVCNPRVCGLKRSDAFSCAMIYITNIFFHKLLHHTNLTVEYYFQVNASSNYVSFIGVIVVNFTVSQ